MIICNIECVATRKMTEEEVEQLWALLKNCGVTEMRFVDYTDFVKNCGIKETQEEGAEE